MAALTENRKGNLVKDNPTPITSAYPLKDGEEIFANSLVVIDTNGDVKSAASGDAATAIVAYATQHMQEDSDRFEDPPLQYGSTNRTDPLAPVQSNIIVKLNSSSLTQDDIGENAYVDDDQTVSTSGDESTESRPYAGVITEVIDASTAWVRIPGITADSSQ